MHSIIIGGEFPGKFATTVFRKTLKLTLYALMTFYNSKGAKIECLFDGEPLTIEKDEDV